MVSPMYGAAASPRQLLRALHRQRCFRAYVASPSRTTVKELFRKGKPAWAGTAVSVEGVVVTWKGTVKDSVDASAEEAKVWVAEAPGRGVPFNARFTVSVAGMDAPVIVETVLWNDAW